MIVFGLVLVGTPASAGGKLARVSVSETSVSPVIVRVGGGGSVKWLNAGEQRHRITSDTRTWPPFALDPGKSRTIAFRKTGRYPYRVDGRRRALVVVSEVVGKTKPPAAAGAPVKWFGVIDSSTDRVYPPGAGSCHDGWSTSLHFAVSPSGSVSGTGTSQLVDGPTCTKITNHPAVRTVKIAVSGSADARRVLLRLKEAGHSPGLPAALWAGFLSVFVKDISAPAIPPTLAITKVDACFGGDIVSTSLVLPTHDRLTAENTVGIVCES